MADFFFRWPWSRSAVAVAVAHLPPACGRVATRRRKNKEREMKREWRISSFWLGKVGSRVGWGGWKEEDWGRGGGRTQRDERENPATAPKRGVWVNTRERRAVAASSKGKQTLSQQPGGQQSQRTLPRPHPTTAHNPQLSSFSPARGGRPKGTLSLSHHPLPSRSPCPPLLPLFPTIHFSNHPTVSATQQQTQTDIEVGLALCIC